MCVGRRQRRDPDAWRTGRATFYDWKTHASPGSTFRYTMSSLLDLMSWDATDQLELIDVPLLMIAGSVADTRSMADDALSKGTGTEDKELLLLDGASISRPTGSTRTSTPQWRSSPASSGGSSRRDGASGKGALPVPSSNMVKRLPWRS